MHLSKQTFKFNVADNNKVFIYNPLSGAMDLIDRKSYNKVVSLLKTKNVGKIHDETLSYLLERGYCYESKEKENEVLMRGFEEFKEREKKSNIRFVIIPTYQCNARCEYCFIGDAIGAENLIEEEVLENAFTAIDAIAEAKGKGCTKQLSLFGGEALINTPAQKRVIEEILKRGSKRGFLIDVVSNGFDLIQYIDLLKKYNVSKVQVTFDGVRDYHNKRRVSVDGKGLSFDRIVSGVDAALMAGLSINSRILLDKNSIEMLPELVSFFKDKGWFDNDNFSSHLGSVFDCFKCQPKEETSKHLSIREGNQKLLEICNEDRSIADLLGVDWQGIRRLLYTGEMFPPTYKTCFGGTRWFAFDLNGGIYACETTAGRPEYQIGTFYPEFEMNHEFIESLEDRNIFTIPQCKSCSQALLCAGGCSFNAHVTGGSLFSSGCRQLKETLQYGFDYYWPEIEERLNMNGRDKEAIYFEKQDLKPSTDEVSRFYSESLNSSESTPCCPTIYEQKMVDYIPSEIIENSFGCGSPVLEANILPGENVIDLGCGAGIDVFLAARIIGESGYIIGVDMTQDLLNKAIQNTDQIVNKLGYRNLEFRIGKMEEIPVEDKFADLVISNCALNLSFNKQKVFEELYRVLKPGGRFIISDIISDNTVHKSLLEDSNLWNNCIAGAMSINQYLRYSRLSGFKGMKLIYDGIWKSIEGINFYKSILAGYKLAKSDVCTYNGYQVIYKGPFSTVSDDDGHVYPRGIPIEVCSDTFRALNKEPYSDMFLFFDVNESKKNTNTKKQSLCC